MTTETEARREPPSIDIYEGREPIEGKGIPEVPGTPQHAPAPPKPKRGRKQAAPAPEPAPEAVKPLPGQLSFLDPEDTP